ncbi:MULTISPECIES: ABC transporter ATP-binding protein [Nonomuraea]|uniref:Spermidine/putrescine import ATP-binding protein PotA n=1 Tax=Nonomuraea ferruginea TaxID=46174 RepID=A0ABT4TE24_9ACTN|nr:MULTISPECIES: ABC transporter ATP-binding protein [Nonomuraea]MDA0647358.1 ABC transporter ATP-binding protein [Nonomuraea ferruginea]TXK42220.1 ABC transporter ATP-binding protein [Nonomuraea sp. C10]
MTVAVDTDLALELRGVSKQYPGTDTAAVSGVDLQIRRGEFVTFLGPSGSGKTTTLNMIAGFISPTAGEIVLHGRNIADLPPHQRNLGMVFQNYALFPHMSVWDNVAFPLVERKYPKDQIRERVRAALEMVNLTGFEKRRPRELSGGQQQRVALTRALVFDPPILLMDEPLSALDKKLRQRLQLEIKRVHREVGITFLFVTHDQEEAMALSDRVVVFDQGRIEQVGTPDELYRRPATRFVAEFLGDSNLIKGKLVEQDGATALATPECRIPLPDWPGGKQAPSGDEHCVMFRPEDVKVLPADDAEAACRATVREVVYLGSEQRVIVTTETGRDVTVRTGGEMTGIPGVGDTVGLRFSASNAWLIPTGG